MRNKIKNWSENTILTPRFWAIAATFLAIISIGESVIKKGNFKELDESYLQDLMIQVMNGELNPYESNDWQEILTAVKHMESIPALKDSIGLSYTNSGETQKENITAHSAISEKMQLAFISTYMEQVRPLPEELITKMSELYLLPNLEEMQLFATSDHFFACHTSIVMDRQHLEGYDDNAKGLYVVDLGLESNNDSRSIFFTTIGIEESWEIDESGVVDPESLDTYVGFSFNELSDTNPVFTEDSLPDSYAAIRGELLTELQRQYEQFGYTTDIALDMSHDALNTLAEVMKYCRFNVENNEGRLFEFVEGNINLFSNPEN
jgi:hypothetical protein